MKKLIPILALGLLSACSDEPKILPYWELPNDVEVEAKLFNQCLINARGPSSVHYNDHDEVVRVCSGQADDFSRYCPHDLWARCSPSQRRTRAEIRELLK